MTTTRASPGKAVRRSGCSTGMSKRFALSFAAGAALLRPRPCGLSGRVSSSSMSYPRPASPSRIAAPKGAVAATAMRIASASLPDRAEDGLGAELGERAAALLRGRPVDDQNAVEMVELVLDHPRLQSFRFDADWLSFRGRSFDLEGGWTLDLDDDGGGTQREATLVGRLDLFARGDDPRVHERYDRLLLLLPVDENPPEDAELGCREPDAAGRSEERRVGKECRSRCDWSSDVCSSDLPAGSRALRPAPPPPSGRRESA